MSDLQNPELPQAHQLVPSRRALLAGAGVACAAILTGCTTYDANNGGFTPSTTAPTTSAPPAASGGATTGGAATAAASTAAAPGALLSTSQVPEGGGTIIDGKNIVITQPEAATFKAFSAVCTHEGCIVSTVADGTIDCPCHGSKFSVKNGSVVNGPATRPLPAIAIKVEGTSIFQA
jgi:Rieske Fe-S protein